jgi:mRNA interferase MazF
VRRGDVYGLRVRERAGHEQRGLRFGVVVQSDAFLPRSTVLVAPTSRSARAASFRPQVDVEGETKRVLVEQMGAVDTTRLGDPGSSDPCGDVGRRPCVGGRGSTQQPV